MGICSKVANKIMARALEDPCFPILPGLPDDVAKYCLTLLPRCYLPVLGAVCKRWRVFIESKEFITMRKEGGRLEEWLYVLTGDEREVGSRWEVLGSSGKKSRLVPPMPGPVKSGFGVVALDGNLLVMAGYSVVGGVRRVSDDVYQYDSRLNRWSTLAKMNVARYDFACSEVDGLIYAVGGHGPNGDSLSSAEAYDPQKRKWTLIESLRRPRWGCFAYSSGGKLYVMGGRSSFTIGNSRSIDVYAPRNRVWWEARHGCVMVTTHAVLNGRLFCMEWKNERTLSVFDPVDGSWRKVQVPFSGSSSVEFRFGVLGGKLLLFSVEGGIGYRTLMYDPDAPEGSEWQMSGIKPTGLCICSVTIGA